MFLSTTAILSTCSEHTFSIPYSLFYDTDNMSILGLTIDYGPYGWIDNFDLDWTPNTTDAERRRYRFGQQPQIAYWNLSQLANALFPVFESEAPLHAGLQRFVDTFTATDRENIARKLGLAQCEEEDIGFMQRLYTLMQDAEVDMTLFFRALGNVNVDTPSAGVLDEAFYDDTKRQEYEPKFNEWLSHYAHRVRRDTLTKDEHRERMNAANPKYVLRNYLAQRAIDRAEDGDYQGIRELMDVLRHPYDDQPEHDQFARRRPDWARSRAGCSMLSCSS